MKAAHRGGIWKYSEPSGGWNDLKTIGSQILGLCFGLSTLQIAFVAVWHVLNGFVARHTTTEMNLFRQTRNFLLQEMHTT